MIFDVYVTEFKMEPAHLLLNPRFLIKNLLIDMT